jgi:hypothetical protein
MKKLLGLCAVFLCAHQLSNAQTQKGNQTLGLNVGVNRTTSNTTVDAYSADNDFKTTGFNAGPTYGYFIADDLELGAAFNFRKSTLHTSSLDNGITTGQNLDSRGTVASIYLRKYSLNKKKFGFRIAPHVDYSWGHLSNTLGPTSPYSYAYSDRTYSAGADFDLVYFPSKRIGLAVNLAGLTYTHTKEYDDAATYKATSNDIKLKLINNELSFTVCYVFGSNN